MYNFILYKQKQWQWLSSLCEWVQTLKSVNPERQRNYSIDIYNKCSGYDVCKYLCSVVYARTESTNMDAQAQMDKDNGIEVDVKNTPTNNK